MLVRLKFFAILRDRAGCSETQLDLPAESTVASAIEQATRQFPAIALVASRVAVAVNLEYSSPSTFLKDGDELALIPPVSGGSQ